MSKRVLLELSRNAPCLQVELAWVRQHWVHARVEEVGSMGLAALFVAAITVLAVAVSIIYGAFVGLARLGRLLWRLLVVPEDEQPAQVEPTQASPR